MATILKPTKPKKCKCCSEKFTPRNTLQTACSPKCAIQLAKQLTQRKQQREEKEQRAAWNKRKAATKPLSHWMNMTQRAFNDYIRARDGNTCISCGITTAISYHAGHYRTTAAASQLRFNEDNVHSQCAACNTHHSGNIGPYRINLIAKIGPQRVEELENNNTPHRYAREELDALRAFYRAKLRELNKQREAA